MSSIIFMFLLVPFVAFLLIGLNLLLAPHKPYKEKQSEFECGFHSFLGQNRSQFSISFFLFGLLFLIFDLEIVLIYPYVVSAYTNTSYGLTVVFAFLIILTAGFVFEIGKKALTINSKQHNNVIGSSSNVIGSSLSVHRIRKRYYSTSSNLPNSLPIVPAVTYLNVDKEKSFIVKENITKSGVYRFTSLISRKCYVGSSANLGRRFNQYFSLAFLNTHKKSSYICRALLKYGYSQFRNIGIL